jgi:hypothetical protein
MAMAKLKSLAKDAISVPSKEELYARKTSEIAAAKSDLGRVVSQIIAAEKPNADRRGYSDLLAKRASLKAKVERLSREAGLLKGELIAARPQPPLTPLQQLFADASKHDPYANHKRGTREQIEKAKVEVANALRDYKLNDGSAQAMAKLNDARLKLAVLEGPPVTERTRRLFSAERLAAARKEQGLA